MEYLLDLCSLALREGVKSHHYREYLWSLVYFYSSIRCECFFVNFCSEHIVSELDVIDRLCKMTGYVNIHVKDLRNTKGCQLY